MAVKKSELYRSLWESCDELRGGMDASQYKNYVLALLFMKYVSDKRSDSVVIPEGGSFYDMVKLKNQDGIGDKMNTIISAFAEANELKGIIDVADFDDDDMLGKGKEKIEKLSNLITIFQKEGLDFSSNRAEGDDILGDAYEYLMRHFATESGKSKGQFYTPAEVSRIMAKVIGINKSKSQTETIYDPTCGSGSLLLKAADEAPHGITIYGQEMDKDTRALAVMNMWLHNNPDSDIWHGNTLAAPHFTNDTTGELETFDFVVANPKFSDKSWTNGLNPVNDDYKRFDGYDKFYPPKKNGDYAYLLHIIKSLKSTGKAAVILPLGVLFRGNTEAEIRKKIIARGYIKGVIGLPPNLFFGTGIAASIIVLDKEKAETEKDWPDDQKGIFMIDATNGFIKEGPKNRLREQDIHKIVDIFNRQDKVDRFSRFVPLSEIKKPKNDYNLNISRYIDSKETEDIQDIEAHMLGDIPNRDIDDLKAYWTVYPSMRKELFRDSKRNKYCVLKIEKNKIKNFIFHHPEFTEFSKEMDSVFDTWKNKNTKYLKALAKDCHPKEVIKKISEELLRSFENKNLIDQYDMYQHIMDYWAKIMQDDLYELAADGWEAGKEVTRIKKEIKKGEKAERKEVEGIEGLEGRLIPPRLMIGIYFFKEQKDIDDLEEKKEKAVSKLKELLEEHGIEEGLLYNAVEVDEEKKTTKVTKKSLKKATEDLGTRNEENADECDMLRQYANLMEEESKLKAAIKKALAELEILLLKKYPTLTIEEIKTNVVDKKWMASIERLIKGELENISHRLTQRIKELADRYETPLPLFIEKISELTEKVENHLREMNFVW
ncbi:MAG TPA: type I restriction-modification system subunit M [Patescibacteria group bacterium]